MAVAAPRLIALVGPTASGKSALAMRLCPVLEAEIVSCDSLQVYRGFDIGSSKPTAEERTRVAHHLIDVVDPSGDFSAADYARLARAAIAGIAERGRLPLVVGGAGLYFRALFRGLFAGPSRDSALRARLEALAARFGDARLHRLLRRVDPDAAMRIAPRDRVRVVRALEVFRATGRPIGEQQRAAVAALSGYDVLLLGLNPGRQALRAAVARRACEMLDRGLLEETGQLALAHGPHLRPLGSIGYRQALAVHQGRSTRDEAEREIVQETMRFAKRQMTWFRKEPGIAWYASADEAFGAAHGWLQASPASPSSPTSP